MFNPRNWIVLCFSCHYGGPKHSVQKDRDGFNERFKAAKPEQFEWTQTHRHKAHDHSKIKTKDCQKIWRWLKRTEHMTAEELLAFPTWQCAFEDQL
jgi:hypothetical protein